MSMKKPQPPAHTQPSRRAAMLRNDDGSLLLVILFTIMMTALVLIATATMISGLAKTRASREYAVAVQAADMAFADVTLRANLGRLDTIAPVHPTRWYNRPGTPETTPMGVTWTWQVQHPSPRVYYVRVTAAGETMDRNFAATLKGTQVTGGKLIGTDGVRYLVNSSQYYDYGFFGSDRVTVANNSAPNVDGYNGARGTFGSNGVLTLGDDTHVEQIDIWGWDGTTRCTGTACIGPKTNNIPQKATFSSEDIVAACATPATRHGHWRAATDSVTELRPGHCYQSLTFEKRRNNDPTMYVTVPPMRVTDEPIYVQGNVTIGSDVHVNTIASRADAAATNLRIATLGNFSQDEDSTIALGVYAPTGECSITAARNGPPERRYNTVFLGAATCDRLTITGDARLRYDGGLTMLVDSTDSTGPVYSVWDLLDFQSID